MRYTATSRPTSTGLQHLDRGPWVVRGGDYLHRRTLPSGRRAVVLFPPSRRRGRYTLRAASGPDSSSRWADGWADADPLDVARRRICRKSRAPLKRADLDQSVGDDRCRLGLTSVRRWRTRSRRPSIAAWLFSRAGSVPTASCRWARPARPTRRCFRPRSWPTRSHGRRLHGACTAGPRFPSRRWILVASWRHWPPDISPRRHPPDLDDRPVHPRRSNALDAPCPACGTGCFSSHIEGFVPDLGDHACLSSGTR